MVIGEGICAMDINKMTFYFQCHSTLVIPMSYHFHTTVTPLVHQWHTTDIPSIADP